MLLAAMINMSVEDNCGIGKRCGKNYIVSTMNLLAVADMYTF
jgi:hypothetical protein